MSACRITINGAAADVRFTLTDDRGQEFFGAVEALKRAIPSGARLWSPSRRVWTVDIAHFGRLTDWAYTWFAPEEVLIERPQRTPPRPAPAPDAWETLWLRPGAPEYVIKAVFRAMALENHPDRGGDHAAMVRINAAFETLIGSAA